MRKVFLVLFLVLVMLFASCSSHLHSVDGEEGTAANTVAVKLCLSGDMETTAQRAISLNSDADSLTYYLQTTALWTGSDIQNPYSAKSQITYTDNMEIGYFSPGSYTFYAEVKNGENIIYTGTATPVYISTVTKNVTIDMELYSAGGSTGSVTIKIAVPKAGENAPDVTYAYSGAASGNGRVNTTPTADTIVDTSGVTSASTNWYYFTKEITGLVPGNYVMNFDYLDANAGNRIGGASVAFTVRNGDEYGVYGTIEEGEYQLATLLLNMPTITLSVTGVASIAKHATETTTITATATAGATLKWYVNGVLQVGETSATFNFSRAAVGRFVITCVATSSDGRISKHASHIIRILP